MNMYYLVCVAEHEWQMKLGSGRYLRSKFTMVCRYCVPRLMRYCIILDEDFDLILTTNRFHWCYARCHRNRKNLLVIPPYVISNLPSSPTPTGQGGDNNPEFPPTKIPPSPPKQIPSLLNLRPFTPSLLPSSNNTPISTR